ncbi:diphthine--ammonia ligase [Bacillus sp. T33-2]|uniref:Dph6-related ATP pyrophosphatase n=1 Tax=Bacillus sp. T33-2 TaxID=2054168 RepID=UPI000C760435|nr:diphthine--ammonia ligase [Bacillus sp. T33-2]PLR94119.1 hypothetical protein CVD19_17710 [Bacillus sp. T33-2]
MQKQIAISWSGGKDSCLALDRLVNDGYQVSCLLTTVPKEMDRTFVHGERKDMIKLQGRALSIPVHFIECTFDTYTESFVTTLVQLKDEMGIEGIAFGDLYLDEHRDWGEKVAKMAGIEPLYPLWMDKEDSASALNTFVESGYQAVAIRIMDDKLDHSWLGRQLDQVFLTDILKKDICPMGEAGEYHTYVFDGPLFHQKIAFETGKIIPLESTRRLELIRGELVQK